MCDSQNNMFSKSKHSDTVPYLFVSVYLVILAFFILLNSIYSTKSELENQALSGVKSTFSISDTPIIGGKKSHIGNVQPMRDYYAALKSVAKDDLAITKADIVEYGNVMMMTIPVEEFFIDGEVDISQKVDGFIEKIAGESLNIYGGETVHIEFLIGTNYPLGEDNIAIKRSTVFLDKMLKLGILRNNISAGILPEGDVKKLTLSFTLYSNNIKLDRG